MYCYTWSLKEIYSDDSNYDICQVRDYVYDGQDDYSDSSDSYDDSFIDDSELDDDAHYFDDQGNIRHSTDANILTAEEELRNMKYKLRKSRMYPK